MKHILAIAITLMTTNSFANNLPTTQTTRMMCSEQCQRWDSFNHHCDYRTTCMIVDNLATYKECLQWDTFNNKCGNEKIIQQYLAFDLYSGSPSCTESCQYQDGFGGCLYRATCNVQPHCASIKYCEKWDNFNRVCVSERIDTACNLMH